MVRVTALQRLRRAVEFGRHIPMRKIANRAQLKVGRVLQQLVPIARVATGDVPAITANVPLPLMQARGGKLRVDGDAIGFKFIGREIALGQPLNWGAPGRGGNDQLWRMNLHYMEYLEEADDRTFESLVAQWIAANPPYAPDSWSDAWNSYTVSLRTLVWMQQLAVRGDRISVSARAAMTGSLAGQIRFLVRNLETDLGGNHLVKNAKALIWASCFFGGVESRQWRATGLSLLDEIIAEQVLADGVHYERSPSYHAQVFVDLMECRRALGADPFGGRLDDALARMAQATADLAHPDGFPALFNDAGLTMCYGPSDCLAAYKTLTGGHTEPRGVFALPAAGYWGCRSGGGGGDDYVVVDCGRIAPDDLPAHGHADVLSFEWSVARQRVIVDQGVCEYVAGAKRAVSRTAASHNTLVLDGADQAEFFGAFRCGRRPRAVRVMNYAARGDGFVLEGTHDGFRHLAGRPTHVRRFDARPTRIAIVDEILGGSQPAQIGFLVHPDVRIEVSGEVAMLEAGATLIRMTSSLPITLEDAVWWPDMGTELATRRLRVRVPSDKRRIETTFEVI